MKQTDIFKSKSEDYERIDKAIRFIETNFKEQPDLDDIANAVNLSKYHFHRLFKRWAGVTPNQFLQYLTIEYSKKLLRESHTVFDVSLTSGLSGGSRLHDLFITFDAITPGEYKMYGKGLQIIYGYHATHFGVCFLATTHRGICALRFVSPNEEDETIKQLLREWPQATFVEEPSVTLPIIKKIFSNKTKAPSFHLDLKGTNFQTQVWRALLEIPPGVIVSYQDIAAMIGKPKSTRAVASAIARNPVAYLIPCHRVIRNSGEIHKYRWGTARKKAMIGWEASILSKKAKTKQLLKHLRPRQINFY